MLKFRQFIVEYLTDKQKEQFSHVQMEPKARRDTDHFFGVDNDKVIGALHSMTDKSEIHKKIENHLGKEISHDDYRAGMTTDHLNRPTRIGRLIKDPQLRDEYARDPTREGSRSAQAQYTTSTVRGTEVAGQTNPVPNAEHPKGHSWANISCKNNVTGVNRHYLEPEIKRGSVVHFVHDHNGQEIYRATLHPHYNDNDHVAYAVESEYGIKHPSFTADAHRVARELSHPTDTSGLFEKRRGVYEDNGERYMLHPNATPEQLHDHIRDARKDGDLNHVAAKLALNHPNADHTHLQTALDNFPKASGGGLGTVVAKHPKITDKQIHQIIDHYPRLHITVSSNPNLKDEHVAKLMKHPDNSVRAHIMSNPATSAQFIAAGSRDKSDMVRAEAYANPKIPLENLIKGLEDPHQYARASAVANKKISGDHLTKAARDESEFVRSAVFRNPNATSEHIDMARHDPSPNVRMLAAMHKNTTSDQMHSMLDLKDEATQRGIAQNPNAKAEHLDRVFKDGDDNARFYAAEHPNASSEMLHKALRSDDEDVRHTALRHPNITTEHLKTAMNHPYDDAMQSIAARMLGERT